jgi:hypothetical protein
MLMKNSPRRQLHRVNIAPESRQVDFDFGRDGRLVDVLIGQRHLEFAAGVDEEVDLLLFGIDDPVFWNLVLRVELKLLNLVTAGVG